MPFFNELISYSCAEFMWLNNSAAFGVFDQPDKVGGFNLIVTLHLTRFFDLTFDLCSPDIGTFGHAVDLPARYGLGTLRFLGPSAAIWGYTGARE